MKKVMVIIGTRPEAIKMFPVIMELKKHKEIKTVICSTGQHKEMLDSVFETFNINLDYNLNIMKKNQTLVYISQMIMRKLPDVLNYEKPDIALVHGDTNTTFIASLICFYMRIPIAHVEAGLRTYNITNPFPEEFNRQAVSLISMLNFVPTKVSKTNLINEQKNSESIILTGNTIVDTFKYTIKENYYHSELHWCESDNLIIITTHRRENLGEPMRHMFRAIKKFLDENSNFKAVFPIHLNPQIRDIANKEFENCDNIHIIEPLGLIDFHNFLNKAKIVLTDSGGIQEEAVSLGKQVLLLRETTERPEGVEAGLIRLVGSDENSIYDNLMDVSQNMESIINLSKNKNIYGDGNASRKIVDKLLKVLLNNDYSRA